MAEEGPNEDTTWAEARAGWAKNLETFARELYPPFKARGMTLFEAMALYHLRRIYINTLPPDEPEEPWRGS